ncbi:hypothetical protein DET47_105115 [Shewanella putrefaciens]|nr:hypothetical protein DET47_105115 [Shewanella putrefaciens]
MFLPNSAELGGRLTKINYLLTWVSKITLIIS